MRWVKKSLSILFLEHNCNRDVWKPCYNKNQRVGENQIWEGKLTSTAVTTVAKVSKEKKMNQEQAKEFVIRELGRNHPKNEVIRQLCEQSGMNWTKATDFIQQVESEHDSEIALKQSPMIVFLGSVFLIGGLILSASIAIMTLQGYVIFFLRLPIPYLGNLFYFVIGVAMVFGGLSGMWSTLKRIWNS
jgi:hypothetical protein